MGFRTQIDAAVAEGFAPEDMALRLTLRDSAALRRNPDIAIEDISYADGEMRFLDVKVIAGGIETSILDRRPQDTPVPEPVPVKKKKKAPVKAPK